MESKDNPRCTKSVADGSGYHFYPCNRPAKFKCGGHLKDDLKYRCGLHAKRYPIKLPIEG